MYFSIFDANKSFISQKISNKIEFFSYVFSTIKQIGLKKEIFFNVNLWSTDKISNEKLPNPNDLSFDSTDSRITEGTQRPDLARVASITRRFAEWKMATDVVKNELSAGDILVIDGSLQEAFQNESKYTGELSDLAESKGIIICGLSKTSRLYTNSGASLLGAVKQISNQVDFERWFLIIGITFSLLLPTLYLSQQAWSQVYPSTNPNSNFYRNDYFKIYIRFPNSWILTEQTETDGILLSGHNVKVTLSVLSPTPGSGYSSANTPIEQTANYVIKANSNSPNIKLISHGAFPNISGKSYYQIIFNENEEMVGPVITDMLLMKSGGNLYTATFSVQESLYSQQNYKSLERELFESMVLGDAYDNLIEQFNALPFNPTAQTINEFDEITGIPAKNIDQNTAAIKKAHDLKTEQSNEEYNQKTHCSLNPNSSDC